MYIVWTTVNTGIQTNYIYKGYQHRVYWLYKEY